MSDKTIFQFKVKKTFEDFSVLESFLSKVSLIDVQGSNNKLTCGFIYYSNLSVILSHQWPEFRRVVKERLRTVEEETRGRLRKARQHSLLNQNEKPN
jgi:hypothetical protein